MVGGKEWDKKGKRSGLSTCQSKGKRSVGDTYQRGGTNGKTPEDGGGTHNEPKAFALAWVTFGAWVGRRSSSSSSSSARTVYSGVGERCKREIVIWSPQRPKAASIARFGQGVFEVSDHGVGLRPHFILFLRRILFYVSLVFPDFSVRSCVATIRCL